MKKHIFLSILSLYLMMVSLSARMDGWYTSLNGGIGFPTEIKVKETALDGTKVRTKTGYAVGASLGHSFDQWRFEFELAHRRNNSKDVRYAAGVNDDVTGDWYLTTIMGNVYYDIPMIEHFDLSIGAGMGYGNVGANIKEKTTPRKFDGSTGVFVYQAMFIPTWNFNDHWSMGVGYRFLGYNNPKLKVDGVKTTFRSHFIHTVEAAIRYAF